MFELVRWISLAFSLFSLCFSMYSLWLSVARNRRLAAENIELEAKCFVYECEILRLKKQLDAKQQGLDLRGKIAYNIPK